jgi:hypothetical protein
MGIKFRTYGVFIGNYPKTVIIYNYFSMVRGQLIHGIDSVVINPIPPINETNVQGQRYLFRLRYYITAIAIEILWKQ